MLAIVPSFLWKQDKETIRSGGKIVSTNNYFFHQLRNFSLDLTVTIDLHATWAGILVSFAGTCGSMKLLWTITQWCHSQHEPDIHSMQQDTHSVWRGGNQESTALPRQAPKNPAAGRLGMQTIWDPLWQLRKAVLTLEDPSNAESQISTGHFTFGRQNLSIHETTVSLLTLKFFNSLPIKSFHQKP